MLAHKLAVTVAPTPAILDDSCNSLLVHVGVGQPAADTGPMAPLIAA